MTPKERGAIVAKAKQAELEGDWNKAANYWRSIGYSYQENICRELAANNTATAGFFAKIIKKLIPK